MIAPVDAPDEHVTVGAELLAANPETPGVDDAHALRWAMVTHAAAIGRDGETNIRRLLDAGFVIDRIFAPEHGMSGEDAVPGETFLGIPVWDLHGVTRNPTDEMLEGVDGVLIDLQDVGVRFYTYVSTTSLCIEECAKRGVRVVVLDRPNPIGGMVEGPLLDPDYRSFVGQIPTSIRHGMTIGEVAMHYNRVELDGAADITVIPVANWRRDMWLDETAMPWRRPSPNLLGMSGVAAYPATCFLEGTNLSEGRGTLRPFELIGAPWLDADGMVEALNALEIPGCWFTPQDFTPRKGSRDFRGERCRGIMIQATDRGRFQSVRASMAILWALRDLHPEHFQWREAKRGYWIDLLAGTAQVRKLLDAGADAEDLRALCDEGAAAFIASENRQASLIAAYDRARGG